MEIGSLRVSLGLDSAEFQSGVSRATAASGKLQASAEQTVASFDELRAAAIRSAGGVAEAASRMPEVGGAAQVAGFHVSNLAAQFSDIGVMLASGQSPLLLAVQQGAQIAPILGQAGAAGAAQLLKGALASILNPMSLITIGSIAAGAALVQWLSGGEEEAKSLEDRVDDLKGATDRYTDALDATRVPLAELRREWGEYADEKLADLREMAELEGRAVQRGFGGLIQSLEDEWGDSNSLFASIQNEFDLRWAGLPGQARDVRRALLNEVMAAFDEMQAAGDASAAEQAAAADRMANAYEQAARAVDGISEAEDTRLRGLREIAASLRDVAAAEADAAEDAVPTDWSARAAIAANERRVELMREVVEIEGEAAKEAASAAVEAERLQRAAYETAQMDLAKAFSDAKSPLQDLLDMLETGQGFLRGWGRALGDYLMGNFGPTEARYIGQIGTQQGDHMERLVRSATIVADQLGIAVEDLLTVISYETMGTFRTDIVNPTGHTGLIQFSQANLEKYAISAGSTVEEQMVAAGNYLKDAGIQAGDSLLRIYAAINAGDPDAIHASDAHNGGAPGTVLDKVTEQMDGHMANAAALLSAFGGTVQETAEGLREAEEEAKRAAREQEQERDRAAREAEAIAKRELGYREDLIAASQRAVDDAQFELSLQGKSADYIAQERAEYILLNQAREAGIDLNERIAGSTQTYGEMIEATSIAVGQAAAEQERLDAATRSAAEAAEEAREAQEKLAAEMEAFVSSLTSRALGPITSNPIGGFLADLPGFQAGAESVFAGLFDGGLGGAATALSTALGGATTGLAGLGTAIGAIAGPVGLAIGLFNGIRGTTEKLDEGLRVMLSGLDTAVVETYETVKRTRFFGLSTSTSTDYDPAGPELTNPIDRAFEEIGSHILDLARFMGKGAKDFAGFSASFELSLEGMTDEEKIRAVEAEFGRISDRLARMAGASAHFAEEGETLTQTLERMVASFGVVRVAYRALFDEQFKTGEGSTRLATKMVDAAGGIDAFTQATDYFLETFYTLEEQAAEASQSFEKALKDLGIKTVPTTEEEFRALVESLEDAGKEVKAASLIALSDDFVEMLDLITQAEEEAAAATQKIADERAQLERELLEVQGDTAAIRELELAALDESNRALQEEIWALEDANALREEEAAILDQIYASLELTWVARKKELEEIDEANRALQTLAWVIEDATAVLDERKSLEMQLAEAQGDTAAVQAMQLEELSRWNRALQEEIWATEEANAVADERAELERQLLELQGDTAALRALELEALDPANRALQEQIWLLEDQKAALDALNASDYASLYDFQKAQGLAASSVAAMSVPAVPPPPPPPAPDPTIRELRDEIRGLREEQRQLGLRNEQNTYAASRVLARWESIGMPVSRAA